MTHEDNILQDPQAFVGGVAVGKADNTADLNKAIGKDQLFRGPIEIATFNAALQLAENLHRPNRKLLLEVYQQTLQHGDLSTAIETRFKRVLLKKFKLKRGETEDEAATKLFKKAWFREFVKLTLEKILYGHSLIQINALDTDGAPKSVQLIPRHHVDPVNKLVLHTAYEPNGLDYTSGKAANSVVEVCDHVWDLGLLMKAAPYVIWNLISTQEWSEFTEIYGMPRLAVFAQSDKNKQSIYNALEKMGSFGHIILNEKDRIEFLEAQQANGMTVFESFCNYCDAKIIRLIIGQTMTMQDGSSHSQSETHMEIFDNITSADMLMVEDVVNDKLLPLLAKRNLIFAGLQFEFVNEINREAQMKLDAEIMKYFELDATYLEETYGCKIVGPWTKAVVQEPAEKKDI